jgi:23S rRNA pseudouridine1911/1915/1917 synthase
MENVTTITITDAGAVGTRLDRFLAAQFPEYSRSYFQGLIDEGLILVNGVQAKSSQAVKLSDVLTITFKSKTFNVAPQPVAFDIVDEQKDFIVVNKPAGLSVHPSLSAPEEVTLINGLLHRFAEMAHFDDDQRPGIVHRLDKNTSGLLLIARNPQAQAELSTLFKNRKIHKKYIAVVHKHPDRSGSVDLPIGRHALERQKMGVFGIQARPALTHYRALAYYPDASLLEVAIVTGRTHQIRVHMASMGHPIVGDTVYGASSTHIGRQALHSWYVAFNFRGKDYAYSCPIPHDMIQAISALKSKKI